MHELRQKINGKFHEIINYCHHEAVGSSFESSAFSRVCPWISILDKNSERNQATVNN